MMRYYVPHIPKLGTPLFAAEYHVSKNL